MSKENCKDELNEYQLPNCFGECRGCLVPHCTHALDCLRKQIEREDEEHAAEVNDMQMAAMGDERYM